MLAGGGGAAAQLTKTIASLLDEAGGLSRPGTAAKAAGVNTGRGGGELSVAMGALALGEATALVWRYREPEPIEPGAPVGASVGV